MSTLNLLEQLRSGRLSAGENVERCVSAIASREAEVGAFIDVFADEARSRAKEIDAKLKAGNAGKLAGLVIAVKNIIAIKGKRLTCASKMLENYIAPYSATAIERLQAADAIIIGTTNMDEFACGSDCTHSALKVTRNPLNAQLVPGGSSGGSAAAVASAMCNAALGSDTAGSVRCPASFCGITALRPTYGRVSRYGLADMGMSFDQISPLSPDAHGSALLLSAIAGADERDATTAKQPLDGYQQLDGDLTRMRIGVPGEFFEGVDAEVSRAVRSSIAALEKSGAQVIELSIPMAKHSVPIYYLAVFAEFSSAMQKYDGLRYGACAESTGLVTAVSAVRERALGAEVKRRILLGTYITTKEHRDEWYTKTLKARAAFKQAFADAFKQCDLLAGPTMPVQPWRIGEMMDNPVQMYLADVLTACANLAGIPAGVTRCGSAGSMPVGLQIHGNYFKEREVLNALYAVEQVM